MFAGEIGLRIFYPQNLNVWTSTRDGMSTHWPNTTKYFPQFGHEVRINSLGMRDRERKLEKGDGVFRILLLGDSFMEAFQVKFEDSFPHLLEDLFSNRVNFPVEVINPSVSGWGTDYQLTYLMRYGVKLKPDLILVAMTLHNDVSENLREEFHFMQDGQLYEKSRQEIPLRDFVILRAKGLLALNSHLFQLIRFYVNLRNDNKAGKELDAHVANLISQTSNDRIRLGWDVTQRLLEKTQSVGEQIGARLVVCLLPLRIQVSQEHLSHFIRSQGLDINNISLEKPQQVMKQWGRNRETEIIDLLPGFRKWMESGDGSLFLQNEGHWNEAGHRLAASIVSEELISRNVVTRDTLKQEQSLGTVHYPRHKT